jgi:hypothetical protein
MAVPDVEYWSWQCGVSVRHFVMLVRRRVTALWSGRVGVGERVWALSTVLGTGLARADKQHRGDASDQSIVRILQMSTSSYPLLVLPQLKVDCTARPSCLIGRGQVIRLLYRCCGCGGWWWGVEWWVACLFDGHVQHGMTIDVQGAFVCCGCIECQPTAAHVLRLLHMPSYRCGMLHRHPLHAPNCHSRQLTQPLFLSHVLRVRTHQ